MPPPSDAAGFLCLVAVIDRATRKVLAWRLSNTMEADFCVAALNDAMDAHGRPEIFDTDQAASSPATPSPARWRTRAYPLDGRSRTLGGQRVHRTTVAGARSNTNACS
jgi:putative transposase